MNCERCNRVPGLPVLCATCQRELLERERATPVVAGPPPATSVFETVTQPGPGWPMRFIKPVC